MRKLESRQVALNLPILGPMKNEDGYNFHVIEDALSDRGLLLTSCCGVNRHTLLVPTIAHHPTVTSTYC